MDTENKRRAACGIFGLFVVHPAADGSVGSADREQSAALYSGIPAAALELAAGIVSVTWSARSPSVSVSGGTPSISFS